MNLILSVVLAVGALFSATLKSSFPAKDAIVDRPPAKVTLTFTENVSAAVSSISILKPDSTEVMKLTIRTATDPAVVEGGIPSPLMPGKYIIRWRTASTDGHAVRGAFAFTIKPHA